MKFPGKRKTKHYFPVSEETRVPLERNLVERKRVYVVGIDQLIVDIEAHVDEDYLAKYNLVKGESQIGDTDVVESIYQELKSIDGIVGEYAGGSTGNTLHNYAVLSDDDCVALGAINQSIQVGDYAYKYICTTNSHVDLSYLKPCNGPMARAMCLITPDKERTFVIGKGIMNDLSEDYIPVEVIEQSSALLISTYLLRDHSSPIFKATHKAVKIAKASGVPVVLSLGTAGIVKDQVEFLKGFLNDYVTILAGNEEEVSVLVGKEDPLLACEALLDLVDMALVTVGKSGLYLGGFCEEECLR
ncbi:unnamed protein product, partial [Chrysoparadoxa australica]